MQTAPSRRQLALIGGGGGEGGGVELGTTDREHCQIVVSTGHESAPPQYSSDPEVSNIILLVKTLLIGITVILQKKNTLMAVHRADFKDNYVSEISMFLLTNISNA